MEPIEWLGLGAIAGAAYLIGKARRPKRPVIEPSKTTRR